MRQSQLTRRTKGARITRAKIARQSPIAAPRYSTGQASNWWDLANRALVLHSTAAAAHSSGPTHACQDPVFLGRMSLTVAAWCWKKRIGIRVAEYNTLCHRHPGRSSSLWEWAGAPMGRCTHDRCTHDRWRKPARKAKSPGLRPSSWCVLRDRAETFRSAIRWF